MRRGFTLMELSVALVLTGLLAGLYLTFSTKNSNAECYTTTQAQMNTVREAIERFSIKNDRFPMPAMRNVGVDHKNYGREAAAGDLDPAVNGAVFGALPFQALGISVENASDCWGNKYTYAVTQALTTSNTNGGFLDPNTPGRLSIKTNATVTFLSEAGYAIISHGVDGLGAVKNNYNAQSNTPASRKWCEDQGTLKTANCSRKNALVSAEFNDGKNPGPYFDDIVVYRGKPWRIGMMADSNVYSWGANGDGQLGDNSQTERHTPVRVKLATGITSFKHISAGHSSCAIGNDDKVYCWGRNFTGDVNYATSTTPFSVTPKGITISGSVPGTFTSLASGYEVGGTLQSTHCATGSDNTTYCWGRNIYGELGNNSSGNNYEGLQTPVGGGFTPGKLVMVSHSGGHGCGVDKDTGRGWCWGNNDKGQLGNGASGATSSTAVGVIMPTGISAFVDIAVGTDHSCAVGGTDVFCWGNNSSGQLGDGTKGGPRPLPEKIDNTTGAKFVGVGAGDSFSCAITYDSNNTNNSGRIYCWGKNDLGQLGINNNDAERTKPSMINFPAGVDTNSFYFVKLAVGKSHACAIGSDRKVYCWGKNGNGQIGNNTTSSAELRATPMTKPNDVPGFIAIDVGSEHTLAIAWDGSGPPAAPNNGGWGDWSSCSGSCAAPVGVKTRSCLTLPGVPCEGLSEIACTVNDASCPPPPADDWSAWGPCSGACGGGNGTQTRTCQSGTCSGPNTQACVNTNACASAQCGSPWLSSPTNTPSGANCLVGVPSAPTSQCQCFPSSAAPHYNGIRIFFNCVSGSSVVPCTAEWNDLAKATCTSLFGCTP